MALINNRQYEFADIMVLVGGAPLFGLRGINYKQGIEREAAYGKGRRPQSIQSGNIASDGDVTMLQADLEMLIAASPGKNILNANIDIIVCYGGNVESAAEAAGTITTDKIIGARFTETPKGMKQGDKFMEITLPFIALDIEYQI